ncbi:MAG: UDP-glucose 4-epimerase GalE [Acidobacteriia bacterium]|nr:UDP-glucose 4-epimerase GalE [Terriglobia bacterium]
MRRILVTGGAGYIGSHTCSALARANFEPLTFDNLSTGHRWAVKWGPLIESDLRDPRAIRSAFETYAPDGVIHFAGSAYVGESMMQPRGYFRNNVESTLNLLDAMLDCGVDRIVFSSSCATYGLPKVLPIQESHPQHPINPYGESKLFIERALWWYSQAYRLRSVALRYFNAAGADPDGELGEAHEPETHLIPLAIAAALRSGPPLRICGTDYSTPDGTCVRDYIHVSDLAAAHVASLRALLNGHIADFTALNLGTGIGHSVLDVLRCVAEVTGQPVPNQACPRRPGDPPVLVADSLAQSVIGWSPAHCALPDIVRSAYLWHQEHYEVPF